MMGWIRANIIGGPENGYNAPDRDFGTALRAKGGAAPPADATPNEEEERLIALAERLETVKDGLDTALHGREPPHLDIGGTALGFVTGVIVRVLAHVIATPERTTNKRPAKVSSVIEADRLGGRPDAQ